MLYLISPFKHQICLKFILDSDYKKFVFLDFSCRRIQLNHIIPLCSSKFVCEITFLLTYLCFSVVLPHHSQARNLLNLLALVVLFYLSSLLREETSK